MPKLNHPHSIPVLNMTGVFKLRYRFYVKDGDNIYRLFALEVMSDGSVIYTKDTKNDAQVWHGNITASRIGTKTVKYKDAQNVEINPSDNAGKITFHASGIINAHSGRIVRDPLRTMDATEPLFTMLHRHVSFMEAEQVKSKKDTQDVLIELTLPYNRHLQSRVFLSADGSNNIQDYIQDGALALISIEFHGDTIEHSRKKLFLQVLIENGPVVASGKKISNKDLLLMIHLQKELVPEHLKPRR